MVFLLMYFVSGFLMVRYSWCPEEETEKTSRELSLAIPDSLSFAELALFLQGELDLPGKRGHPRANADGSVSCDFVSVGKTFNVMVAADRRRLTVEERPHGLFRRINVLHRFHRFGGGLVYDLYVLMMDLASIALITFVITGVPLWLMLPEKKRWGVLFLALGLGYTAWVTATFLMR